MNFNYSYRALLVSSLLLGMLYLCLWGINISAEIHEQIETTPVEYLEIQPELEETPKLTALNNSVIETNKAYNEAEKFIRESEQERLKNLPLQKDLNSIASHQTAFNSETIKAIEAANKRLLKNQENSKSVLKKIKNKTTNGISKKTTISYSLKSRQAILLNNPVYTCDNGGKIVINIEVDTNGAVTKTSYNKNASSTTNGCLIESAIMYAEKAQFSSSTISNQLGSITYNFPGQD